MGQLSGSKKRVVNVIEETYTNRRERDMAYYWHIRRGAKCRRWSSNKLYMLNIYRLGRR